jgi:hypothetical protein
VHAWTDRPIWPQGLQRPKEVVKVPSTLDWDNFIGPAPFRPYNPRVYSLELAWLVGFRYGSFWRYGLPCARPYLPSAKARLSDKIQGSFFLINTESPPQSEQVEFTFPSRDNMPKVAMPEVKVYWYDGGLFPHRPDLLPDGTDLMRDGLGGCLFVGSKDTLLTDCGGFNPRLLSGRTPKCSSNPSTCSGCYRIF